MEYRIDRQGNQVTVWDDRYGVALRFREGESLQRYESSLVLANPLISEDEAGMAIIQKCQEELTAFAAGKWQNEFQEMKSCR